MRQRRQLVSMLLADYRVSEQRDCATVFLQRSVYRYVDQPRDDRAVRQRLKEIVETRVSGFERNHVLLRRERWLSYVEAACNGLWTTLYSCTNFQLS